MRTIKTALLLLGTFAPSPVRLLIWRLLGFKVGRGCHVSMFSIVVADRIELGHGAVIDPLTLVYRPTFFSMGERARIGGFVRIIGRRGRVVMEEQSWLALGCLIDSTGDFEVGRRSEIGPRSTLYSHGATGLLYNRRYPHRIGPTRIGSDCWVGMGCLVHPNVTVGDRVIVFPGLAIRKNVANDTAIVAPDTEHRLVPTDRLLIGVDEAVQQEKIDGLLRQCAAYFCCSRLDEASPDVWRLALPWRRTVYLLRSKSARIDPSTVSASRSVVWTLSESGAIPGIPTFCFSRLTVFGERTRLAEQVAAFLCREGGVRFIFRAGLPETGSPGGGSR